MNKNIKASTALFTVTLYLSAASVVADETSTSQTETQPSVAGKVIGAVEHGVEAAARGVEHGVKAAATGIERGAKATVSGIQHGVKAAAHGVERGAKATGDAANKIGQKVDPDSTDEK